MMLTILTPTLNCATTLRQTLASVEAIRTRIDIPIQHRIGDGGSDDGTLEILAGYCSRNPWATVANLPGLRIPDTLNELLPPADTGLLLVLNGDDYLCQDGFPNLLDAAAGESRSGAPRIHCGDVAVLSLQGDPLGHRSCNTNRLGHYMSVNHPAMLVDTRLFEIVGSFDPASPSAYDYAWVWRAWRQGTPFLHVPVIAAFARLGGLSSRAADQAQREIFRAKLNGGAPIAAARGLIIHRLKRIAESTLPKRQLAALKRTYHRSSDSVDNYSVVGPN